MVIAAALWVTGCASLPPLEGRSDTRVLADTSQTRLARAIDPLAAAHPGKTGIHALSVATDAFAARVLLAAAAEKSLDVQYYIWHGDQTGMLLYEAMWAAAERGVRVRMLLDDNNTAGLDEIIATLDAHPNIEVRLYNPVMYRGSRMMNFLTDFERVNRRMHNKSFTADDKASIVGGRNIGNEYFGAGEDSVFADLDVLAVGAAVPQVSSEFDLFWNSASAYPAASIVPAPGPGAVEALKARFAETRSDFDALAYVDAVRVAPLVKNLLDGRLDFEWDDARVVHDDPAKTLDKTERRDILLLTDIVEHFGRPQHTFDLVSPYFVPGAKGTAALASMAEGGVETRVLTNSLGATDVTAVHAGYSKSREALLRAGVKLYELKSSADTVQPKDVKRKKSGSSPESLHAKTFAEDGKRIFVGSFNFDPRSALLNTEMGLVIDSPILAQRLHDTFVTRVPKSSYEVRLTAQGSLEWIEQTPNGVVRHETEPDSSAFKRATVWFLSLLPIDWLL
jgi:cardiolipin synthase C